MARRPSSTAFLAARTATACCTPLSDAARASTEGRARSRSASAGLGSLDPALLVTLDLLLPDRRLGLDSIDDLARARERLAAVGRGRGHDHARLGQRHLAHSMLDGSGAESVPLDRFRGDLRHALLGHLHVGVVLETLDATGNAR